MGEIDVRSIEATRVVFEGEAAQGQQGLPHKLNGHKMDTPEWLAFQARHIVHYVYDVLNPNLSTGGKYYLDPDAREYVFGSLDDDEKSAIALSARLRVRSPRNLFKTKEYNGLMCIDPFLRVMKDWIDRFGPLFRHTCKQEGVSTESASNAVGKY